MPPTSGLSQGPAEEPIALGPTKQLFLDDFLIADATGVRRRIHEVRKHPANPVLRATEPYERNAPPLLNGSVLRDEGRYRMWHLSGAGVHYAESDDGITWSKPQFDFVLRDGQKTNIVVAHAAAGVEGFTLPHFNSIFGVHRDDRDPDASRRYKMIYLGIERDYRGPRGDPFHPTERRGVSVAASPDGIHWRVMQEWATEAICDGGTHLMWDPAREKYVLYGRTKHIPPELAEAWGLRGVPSRPMPPETHAWIKQHHWGRAVARVESPDFVNWDYKDPASAPVVMTADTLDGPGDEIYDMMVFPYESVYIGLARVFHNLPQGTYLDIQLAASRDGAAFTRVGDRAPFIPVGPVGSWDRFNSSSASNPPFAEGDELWFYYGGRDYRHSPYKGADSGRSAGIGLGIIPRDRFVSLGAAFDGGTITTKPLRIEGRTIHLNAKADFGEIVVEMLDLQDKLLGRSKPIQRDGLDLAVEWERAPRRRRTPAVLRLTLKNALLFALWSS